MYCRICIKWNFFFSRTSKRYALDAYVINLKYMVEILNFYVFEYALSRKNFALYNFWLC